MTVFFHSLNMLYSALNLVAAEAPCTGVNVFGGAVDHCFDPLHVGLPSAVGAPVGVADFDSKDNAFIAVLTFCHLLHLL